MAKVFLDANKLIDIVEKRKEEAMGNILDTHEIFISPLSVHILSYITKVKVPHKRLTGIIESFSLVIFDQFICYQSLAGPTNDFEDNVQLHSAASTECDIFLTSDKKLLGLKFFGKTRILPELAKPPVV